MVLTKGLLHPLITCTVQNLTNDCGFCSQGPAHQALLCNMGAVTALMPLLVCDIPKIQQPALQCYAAMSFQNGAVSLAMKSGILFIVLLLVMIELTVFSQLNAGP